MPGYKSIRLLDHPQVTTSYYTGPTTDYVNAAVYDKFMLFLSALALQGITELKHLGIYNRRFLRNSSGRETKGRWSYHSWYMAMDVKCGSSGGLKQMVVEAATAAGFNDIHKNYSWGVHVGDKGPDRSIDPPPRFGFKKIKGSDNMSWLSDLFDDFVKGFRLKWQKHANELINEVEDAIVEDVLKEFPGIEPALVKDIYWKAWGKVKDAFDADWIKDT